MVKRRRSNDWLFYYSISIGTMSHVIWWVPIKGKHKLTHLLLDANERNSLQLSVMILISCLCRAFACNFTKSNTPPWMFFTFLKLYEWYQMASQLFNCMAGFNFNTKLFPFKFFKFFPSTVVLIRKPLLNKLLLNYQMVTNP